MQTFAKNKVALAVGAALMVMAGAAQAAAVVPLAGATKTLLATTAGAATAAQLYAPAGTVNAVRIAYLATGAIANGGATTINTGTIANDDVTVQFGATIIPAAQVAVAFNTAGIGNGIGNIVVTITPAGTARVRINNTNGALEYTADGTATTPVWAAVTMSIQVVAGNALTEAGTAIDAGTAATTAFASSDFVNTAAQTVKTYAVAAADKISGLTVDFAHPVTAPTKTTLSLNSVAVAPLSNAVDISNAATAGITAVTYTLAAGSTTAYDVVLTNPALVDWNNNGTINAGDALLYAPVSFNTGVQGATSPLSVTVAATGPAYSNIFAKTTGVAATVAAGAIGGAVVDGAAPVIVANGITFSTPSAATPSLTDVGIIFSEPMTDMGGASTADSNLREVLENVSVGSNTLAALSLNSGVTPTLPAITTTDGRSTVTVSGVATDDVATVAGGIYTGKSMSVSRGITYQEINDTNYTTKLAAGTTLDDVSGTGPNGEELAGGVKSASGVVEAIPATPVASVAVAPVPSVVWGTDTSALASASSAASPDLIDTITVTFAAGKGVKLAPLGTVFGTAAPLTAAKTAADLAANLVVDVFGSNGIKFQIRPTSATLDTANIMTVKVPTALIYSKLTNAGAQLKSVWIGYNADGTNNTNNTLVSTDASSTLLSPVIVAKGLTSATNGAWVTADLTRPGAEPVVLPLVFTAVQTGNQSTLLTQDVQGNIAGATAGSIVNAYLAYWADAPTTTANATITSGKITNPGDKVATDLAIEFVNGAGVFEADAATVASAVATQLQKVAPASPAKPGISNAVPAGVASPFPVYVKLVRSNDPVAGGATNGSQNYLNARAVLGTTFASVASSTPRGSNPTNDETDPVYEVMLNPNTGAITGRLTGNIVIKAGTSVAATANRGLRFLDGKAVVTATPTVIGSSVVAQKSATGLALPGTANINLLMGIDPASNDLSALTSKNPFVLLVLQDSTGKYTQLTSANPLAANYMPFAPDVLNKATGTGGIAKRAPMLLSVTDVKALYLPAAANWALYGFGNRAMAAKPAVSVTPVNAFPRDFVGLNTITGVPVSFWTNDGATFGDMALSMAGNQVGVATDLTTTPAAAGSTLSTIGTANMVKGAEGLAWANADGVANGGNAQLGNLYVAQATGVFAPATAAPAPTVAAGWSLVNVPGVVGAPVASLGTVVDAVIKVGAQVGVTGGTLTTAGVNAGLGKGQFTWLAEDGAMPALTAGEAVFVHAKAKGSL